MTTGERARVERYLRGVFGVTSLRLAPLHGNQDCAEVFLGEEYIGLIFKSEEDGEFSYNFHMPIAASDLPIS